MNLLLKARLRSELDKKNETDSNGCCSKKWGELSVYTGAVESRIPSPRSSQGDETDQATADAEAERQSRLHRTDGRLSRGIVELLAAMQSKPPLVECGIGTVASAARQLR
jgi:hypothetical protein